MMLGLSVIVVLLEVVLSAPQFSYKEVEWFKIKSFEKTDDKRHNEAETAFDTMEKEWDKFKQNYRKTYESVKEEIYRFSIFANNLDYITKHNRDYNKGIYSYYLGINHLADLEFEEFRKLNGYRRHTNRTSLGICSSFLTPSNIVLLDAVDWRDKGYVTPVKNQGSCGSCWAFSTTGSLEGQHFKKTETLKSLSEQQLVDCSGKFGNEGCEGGFIDEAFTYIKSTGGIEAEHDYPYTHKEATCHSNQSEYVARVTGCVDLRKGSEEELKTAVTSVGPVSVAIDANHKSFQHYSGGTYDEPDCSEVALDHAVLVVGYGTSQEGQDYWIVKNSWSTDWGQEGYIMMSRNKNNQCGIATDASFPRV